MSSTLLGSVLVATSAVKLGHDLGQDEFVSRRTVKPVSAPRTPPEEIKFTPNFLKPNYRSLSLLEKLSYAFCSHDFTWPFTNKDTPKQTTYLKGFDCEQSCTKCGVSRFYNSETMTPGPLFQRTDVGAKYLRQQAAFDVYVDGDAFAEEATTA